MTSSSKPSFLSLALFFLGASISWAGHPSQGLWVGEVSLNAVNEATGAVGDSNTYEFKNPELVTPTTDTAFLRLILHVNGAGQVSLLKSVAIVEGGVLPDGTKDVLLITDPNLYPQNPGIAKRISTAFFDFGDQRAVTAVQELIDNATNTAVSLAMSGKSQTEIETSVRTALNGVVDHADVDSAYLDRGTGATSFITTDFFTEAEVHIIADQVASLIHAGTKRPADFAYNAASTGYSPFPTDPLGGNFAARVTAAQTLRDRSFYKDTRGIDAIVGVVVAAARAVETSASSADLATKKSNARRAAEGARHNAADITQAYNRFIAGSGFFSLRTEVPNVAVPSALDAKSRGKSQAEIVTAVKDALYLNLAVKAAYTSATTILSASLWGDPRARWAVDALVDSAANSAAVQVNLSTNEIVLKKVVADAVASAFDAIQFAPVFESAPSAEYSGFVTDTDYQNASNTAAKTAASEAFFQYAAGVRKAADLKFLTLRAVNKALLSARNQAAVLPQNSIPLSGGLAPGDSLAGTIHLPALAPTNPFLHRRHPDHTEGFDITRKISLETNAGDVGRSGYGVSRLTGTYKEEIFGLHKPLGNASNIGLRTQGTFTLNRLSFVDSLNF